MAMLMSVMSFAETELFTQTYPGSPSTYTSAYTKSFTLTTGDYTLTYTNVNNGQATGTGYPWTIIRTGSKNGASVATIASEQIAAPIAKVVINFTQANASSTNALYLEVSANSDFSSATKIEADIAVGSIEFPIATPAANQYYKITIDQAKGSANGFNRFDKVVFYQGDAAGEDVETVAAPEFSVTEANFKTAFTLDITSEEGTTLKYTIDNTDPSTSATAIEVATNSTTVQITKSTAVKAIAIKGELKSVTKSKVYCYVNSAETAYTVAEAMEVIDAGLGLANELYVKGEISEIEKFDANYGSITYWIKDEEGNKFECYSGLGLNKAKFTKKEDLVVGSKVVVCGVMKKYNTIYEFNYNNYIVSLELPVAKFNVTVTAENGTVTGAGEYIENAEVTLEATAAEGYEFTCWTSGEDTVSTENPYTFVVTANVALVANFKEVVVEEPVEAKLYLTPNANWKQSNARFAVYFYGNGETWVSMTKVAGETDLYEVTIPTDKKYPNVIFCRMNPSAAANNWTNKWNQTEDLTIPTDGKNHYTVKENTWDKGGGTWSIWPVPTVKTYVDITITVTANAPASIKWANAGDKLADATEYVAMTAGENNTYTYTLAQVDEFKGVDYTVKVGETVSATQNTSKNVTVDFKALLPQVAVQGVNNWDGTDKMTIADDYLTASITLPLVAKKYDLKLTVDGAWKGTTSNNITRENNSSAFTGDSGNGSITADVEGDYVFTYTYATKTLTVTYPELVTTITATFDLTQEKDTRNMGGTYNIYAGDYTLRIYGYNGAGTYQDDPTTEEDAAPMLFTPDYEDPLDAVVVVTIDEENNKEVMQVTATSADGKKIYNLTINIALPSYETYSLVATNIKAENGVMEDLPFISLKGEGYLNGEEAVPFEFMVYESMMGYGAEGTIGEIYVYSTVAEFFAEEGGFYFTATMQDEEGKYLFKVEMMGTMPKAEVEIVVKETKDVTLYNLNLDVQGNMAMVDAANMTLSFNLTLLDTENYYGNYTNDAFSNIWYGDDKLYAAYGEAQVYAEVDGKAKFVVSFISTPDAEGNVTLYNFTLYAGDQPVDSKHTVTILVTPEGAGTVTGAGEYEDGTEVTVTAEENDEYIFMGWYDATGELLANDYEYKFQVLEDVTLIAYYLPYLEGESNDLVIGENTLTASAELSIGKLNMNLVLGEEEEGMYWLAETTTLSIDGKAATLVYGIVYQYGEAIITEFLAEYNGELYFIAVAMVAPETGVDNIQVENVAVKMIKNGQLIINKNGVEYNVQGAQL